MLIKDDTNEMSFIEITAIYLMGLIGQEGINLVKTEMGAIKAPIENIHNLYILFFKKTHDILFII